ncbi:hypothetical protein GGR51DRAFT_568970 [Nemania sp. FL0031]|nr:hypothetical protein GGR51DRAFT_568970 [Nemania sp. FL0031]
MIAAPTPAPTPTSTPSVALTPAPKDSPPSYAEALAAIGAMRGARPSTSAGAAGQLSNSFHSIYAFIDDDIANAEPIFPTTFSVYYGNQPGGTKGYYIGESKDRPLYTISTETPMLDLVLYSTLSRNSPALASIVHHRNRCASITMLSPAHTESQVTAIPLDVTRRFAQALSFSMEIPTRGGRRESFEWRHSSGAEIVEALGYWERGWKLVRVPPTTAARLMTVNHNHHHHHPNHNSNNIVLHSRGHAALIAAANASRRGLTARGASSDGREVVAVWGDSGLRFSSKKMRFRFLGSGADGSLGQRWAVMAVATALAIWYWDQRSDRRRRRSRVVSSAGF